MPLKIPRVVLISGTPGVGKSTICSILSKKGFSVLNINDFLIAKGLYYGFDHSRGSVIIDEPFLELELRAELSSLPGLLFIEGHASELVPKEFVS